MIWGIESLRPYFERTIFQIQTDHYTFEWMLAYNDPNRNLMTWRLRLREFAYEVLYRPILVYHIPDAFSRLLYPSDTKVREPIYDEIPTLKSSPTALGQRMKEKRILNTFYFRQFILDYLCGYKALTLAAIPLLMITWAIFLTQAIRYTMRASPGCAMICLFHYQHWSCCKSRSMINSFNEYWPLKPVLFTQV